MAMISSVATKPVIARARQYRVRRSITPTDDYLAIWDAYNGTDTGTNITGTQPPGRSQRLLVGHAVISLSTGYVDITVDDTYSYVAVEVL